MTYEALILNRESSIQVFGKWIKDNDNRAKGTFKGYELQVDYWKLIGNPDSEFDMIFTKDSNPDILLNQRHLVLRGSKTSIIKMRSIITQCFREHFFNNGYI